MSKNNPDRSEDLNAYCVTDADFDAVANEISRYVASIEDTPNGQAYATGMLKAAVIFEHRLRERSREPR
ncbi:hypothetical protein C440_05617 [Haloferax mucosum ATCC BAA-1512]|uniref:Uncharacterized protein n=1 Tax=Haloferax mucosum ATCC BAA-1512 TaxID=662479 RepID=M0IJN1_9EURY|nr:hypothetical protein [Haloferax mucosum]ELZ96043.1 hypothetical protein C440_05617 [Haloferax mucosum ATCC BAA-1512]